MNYVLFQLISLTAIFIFAMEYFLVLLPFCNPACPSKVKGIDEDVHCVMSAHSLTSTVWQWVVLKESEQPNCSSCISSIYKASWELLLYVESSWSHEPEFSVQFISQPFWSTPCLLRTTNPIRTQHPGSSEQILEVISAVKGFFRLN